MGCDPRVPADQGNLLDHGLSDEQPIEWVSLCLAADLHVWQPSIGRGVSGGNGKKGKSLREQLLCPLLRNLEFAQRRFDRDLEERPSADERLLGSGDRLPGGLG